MKTYTYKGLDGAGRVRRGLIEAESLKHVRERLAAEGVLCDHARPTERRVRVSREARATMYRELGALLGAGMPLAKALELLIESPEAAGGGFSLDGVRERVNEGVSLGAALADASPSVTEFEQSIIRAAEASASVDVMLKRLAAYLEAQEALRERIRNALIYPCIVVAVGVGVAVLMLGVLLPQARKLMPQGTEALPWLTRLMTQAGRIVMGWAWLAVGLAVAAGVGIRARWQRDPGLRIRLDRSLFRLRTTGYGYRLLVTTRFCQTLAILLRGGVPLLEAVRLAGRATGSPWTRRLVDGQAARVRQGTSLSEALRHVPPLAEGLPGWIQVGEAGGDLATLLDHAGQRAQERWERFLDRALKWIEPLLILSIGAFVLLVTLSVLLPILEMTRSL